MQALKPKNFCWQAATDRSITRFALACWACLFAPSACLWAQPAAPEASVPRNSSELSAADLLPSSTLLYLEIAKPSTVVDFVLNHPLRAAVESLPQVVAAKESQAYVAFRGGVALFEASMTMYWPQAVDTLTSGGLVIGFDAKTEGFAALALGKDAAKTELFRETVLSAIRMSGKNQPRVKEGEYRGIKAHQVGPDLRLAVLDRWLLVTNKAELGQSIIERFLDSSASRQTTASSLATQPKFISALKTRNASTSLWGFADIASLREAGVAPKLYSGKTPNILVEILAGGILSNLQQTPFGTLELSLQPDRIAARATAPHDPTWIGERREYFFGASGNASAPGLLEAEDRIASLSAYRGVAEMWLRSGDLLTEKASEELAQVDATLSTFFSGRDFGEDVLSALDDQVQLIVAAQHFDASDPQPVIKLPAFAVQVKMKNPAETEPEMRRVFMSLIGFLNVIGAMNGQPQFDFDMRDLPQGKIIAAIYVPPSDEAEMAQAPINFNFTPCLAFVGERLIVASTQTLARQLVQQPPARPLESKSNTLLEIAAAPIRQALHDNIESLIAQNMLENGHPREAAEAEIGLLLDLLGFFDGASLELKPANGQLSLDAEIRLQLPAAVASP